MTCAKKKRIQTRSYGKVEFCLTTLQALCANSSPFAAPRLIDVLNAFGLFARTEHDSRSTSIERGLLSMGWGIFGISSERA
jgi:hypothetical protein